MDLKRTVIERLRSLTFDDHLSIAEAAEKISGDMKRTNRSDEFVETFCPMVCRTLYHDDIARRLPENDSDSGPRGPVFVPSPGARKVSGTLTDPGFSAPYFKAFEMPAPFIVGLRVGDLSRDKIVEIIAEYATAQSNNASLKRAWERVLARFPNSGNRTVRQVFAKDPEEFSKLISPRKRATKGKE